MTSGGKYSSSLHSEIEWTWIDTLGDLVYQLNWLEPDHWSHAEQNLWITLSTHELLMIPLESFHVHTIDQYTMLWNLDSLWVLDNLKIDSHSINWNLLCSSVVLLGTSQETMHEEELVDPEDLWDFGIKPRLHEGQSILEILDVATKWLQRDETPLEPQGWDLVVYQLDQGLFKLD